MKKKMGNNISLKILSLVIAVVVWLLVVNIDNPVGTKSFVISDVQLLNEATLMQMERCVCRTVTRRRSA